jgi:hypothetical protein
MTKTWGPSWEKHLPATNNERRRRHRPGRHGQVPATNNERRRGLRPGQIGQVLLGAAGVCLGTAINFLRRTTTSDAEGDGMGNTAKSLGSAASIGLGTTIKFL